jgi:putative endonuclease
MARADGNEAVGKGGWVYIMTNGAHGTLYIGVTADLAARVTQHREGRGSEFCARYGLTRLVHAEWHDEIRDAIIREKAMKKWKRQWKLKLICARNPHWDDLYQHIQTANL